MSRCISTALLAALFSVLIAFGSVYVQPYTAQAQITDEQIEEQNATVHMMLADTMREYLKLVQLLVIQQLEEQVTQLEERLAAR